MKYEKQQDQEVKELDEIEVSVSSDDNYGEEADFSKLWIAGIFTHINNYLIQIYNVQIHLPVRIPLNPLLHRVNIKDSLIDCAL